MTVSVQVRTGGAVQPLSDSFTIAYQDTLSTTPETIHEGSPSEIQYFRSRPDLRPPVVTVTASSPPWRPAICSPRRMTGRGRAGR